MYLQICRRVFPEADHKPFHLALPEWDNDAAAGFYMLVESVNKRPRKRQAHRDVGVHT